MGSFKYEDLEDDLCKCNDNNDSFAEFCRIYNVDLVQFRKEWLCGGFKALRKKCRGSLYNLLSWQEYVLLHAKCVSDAKFVDWLNFIPDNVKTKGMYHKRILVNGTQIALLNKDYGLYRLNLAGGEILKDRLVIAYFSDST